MGLGAGSGDEFIDLALAQRGGGGETGAVKVYIDNKPIEIPEPTLAAALTAGVAVAEQSGRIVIEVHADGEPIEGDLLATPSSEPMTADELRLTTADPKSLVCVTLGDAAEGMSQAAPRHKDIAEQIQGGETAEAMESLGEVLSMWQAARQAVESGSAVLGEDILAGVDGGEGLLEQLAGQLAELQTALMGEDWSTVADVLSFDLTPQAERFAGALKNASEGLQG